MQVRKGDTISEFLQADLIIPHQHDFYEVIVNKARGKSGFFHFDMHEDVRTIIDATTEKDESYVGKVVESGRYEKNKHIVQKGE
ncbi:unnamed protein product [Lactuca virosa]|uniref:FAM50A/XAP5 C-terminal domain-containing protein n=1 Tax=Lactuca virosa TaxID=75947 RepID=A0AAU9PA35_9ASTR|nr:unnamed protein product [Lactuca virosa]